METNDVICYHRTALPSGFLRTVCKNESPTGTVAAVLPFHVGDTSEQAQKIKNQNQKLRILIYGALITFCSYVLSVCNEMPLRVWEDYKEPGTHGNRSAPSVLCIMILSASHALKRSSVASFCWCFCQFYRFLPVSAFVYAPSRISISKSISPSIQVISPLVHDLSPLDMAYFSRGQIFRCAAGTEQPETCDRPRLNDHPMLSTRALRGVGLTLPAYLCVAASSIDLCTPIQYDWPALCRLPDRMFTTKSSISTPVSHLISNTRCIGCRGPASGTA